MTEKTVSSPGTEVKALRIVLIIMLVLYGSVFIAAVIFLVTVFPSFVGLSAGAGFWADIRVFLDRVLTGPIYFVIAYCIFRLIGLISRGEPFSPGSPRYIRRIGHAVFGLTFITAVVNAISEFTSPASQLAPQRVFISEAVVRVLYSSLSMLLLGFGFLIIAKVIETGVRIQQDQNLTV
jgi:hypothetical protein